MNTLFEYQYFYTKIFYTDIILIILNIYIINIIIKTYKYSYKSEPLLKLFKIIFLSIFPSKIDTSKSF